jgi:hypothetical protein
MTLRYPFHKYSDGGSNASIAYRKVNSSLPDNCRGAPKCVPENGLLKL